MTQPLSQMCVIGAGVAGLACALAGAMSGLRVRVFDEASPKRSLPASVDIGPSMLRDLVELGVGESCVRAGFPYRGIDVIDSQGRLLHELPTDRLAGARYPAALGIGLHEFHRVLERAAVGRGVSLASGMRVEAVQTFGEQARIVLSSGERVDADFVVLAAGSDSDLRGSLFPHGGSFVQAGQVWWHAMVQRPVKLDRPLIAFGGAGCRVAMVPVRSDAAGLALIEPMPDAVPASPAAHLRAALASFAPAVRAVAAQLTDALPIAFRPARSGLLEPPWHRGAVLAVGDCAHTLPPHFGQSVAQAISDAKVLADLLVATQDRATVFEAFQHRRIERVRRVHALTSSAMRWEIEPESHTDLSLLMQRLANTVAQPA